MNNIELERTFLAKYLPDNLREFPAKEICDVYADNKSRYSNLRLRKNGSKYEITRKESINNDDASKHIETTINLVAEEFNQLTKFTDRVLLKRRFDYTFNNVRFEIDVFIGRLEGLVLVDVEFENEEAKDNFEVPDFCLADVTQDEFAAGRFLYTRTYDDIKEYLDKYNYKKIVCEF